MGRVYAIANQKGGVGKTTTSVNAAASLAVAEKRTLLIDMDPQGNAGSGLGSPARDVERGTYDVLLGRARIEDVLRPTAAARPQEQRRSAQDVVNAIAAAQPHAPEQLRIPRVPGDRNRAPPFSGGQPAGSSQDIMRPTSAPMASSYGLSPAPPLPALPPARRRNRGPPVAAS